MAKDERFDANVDYGNVSGNFVRLDIQDEGRAGNWAWVGLTASEARSLAELLVERADRVDSLNSRRHSKSEPE